MSETGLLGLVLFLASVVAFMAPKSKVNSPQSKELVAINYAVLVYIILGLIRNGNYINVGFFLFYFLYYFSWLQVKYPSYKTLSKVRTQSTGRRFEARRRLA
jgi:hypothetical protein